MRKHALLIFVGLLVFGGVSYIGCHWWFEGRFEETTDNAFLQADKVIVAPKVGGFIAEVYVSDNQPVKARQALARIDDQDYRIALLQSQADLEKSKASLEAVSAALTQQQAKIKEAEADVATTRAAIDFAMEEQKRYSELQQRGAGTTQRSHQATSEFLQRQAAHKKANAAYESAQKQLDALRSLESAARAGLERAEINLKQAQLSLDYTSVPAPIDGVVGDRALRKGQFVQPGSNLLTIVPMGNSIYLIANFKATQLFDMTEKQSVKFTVDAFGGHLFRGQIDSFAPGTGAQFALLPPENATGNFTKIVQRVPVKIMIDSNDPFIERLRPGLSAEATIDIRQEPNQISKSAIKVGALKGQDEHR